MAEFELSNILVPRLHQHTSNVNNEYVRESDWSRQLYCLQWLFTWDQLLEALIHLTFITLILICFKLIMPGVNYVIYGCSSARVTGVSLYWCFTLEENIIAVIIRDRVKDGNLKRQIKSQTLCTIRLFIPI